MERLFTTLNYKFVQCTVQTHAAPWHHSPAQTQYTYTTGICFSTHVLMVTTAFIQPAINHHFLIQILLTFVYVANFSGFHSG